MRGSKGGVRGAAEKSTAGRQLRLSDVIIALPLFIVALYVHFGGLGGGRFTTDAATTMHKIPGMASTSSLLLRKSQDAAAVQPPAFAHAVEPAAPAPQKPAAPAPAPPAAAPPPAAVAPNVGIFKPAPSQARVRPTPPSRPVLDDAAAPSAPPLAPTDPLKPNVPLSTVTFVDGGTVNVYPHELQERSSLATLEERDWWPTVMHGWERDTQHGLRAALAKRKDTVYIDFGSWIGPTVLFAAPYASHVYALEPDTSAYRELFWNVRANPAIAARTTVMNLCISNSSAPLTMHGVPGSSMSAISHVKELSHHQKEKGFVTWEVQCMTLDAFVEKHKIDPHNLVIKIDTEGAERDILQQLGPWIKKYRPTLLLSWHVFAYKTDFDAHKALKEITFGYKHVLWPNGHEVDTAAISLPSWCSTCAMV